MIIGFVPWIIIVVWLLKNQCDEAAGEKTESSFYTSDYFTGIGLRPEALWGHGCFDNVLAEENQCKTMESYFSES